MFPLFLRAERISFRDEQPLFESEHRLLAARSSCFWHLSSPGGRKKNAIFGDMEFAARTKIVKEKHDNVACIVQRTKTVESYTRIGQPEH